MRWIIVGAGAQGRITLDILHNAHPEDEFLFVDDDDRRIGQSIGGVPIVARRALAQEPKSCRVVIAIGRNPARLQLADKLTAEGFVFGTAIHPSAIVMPSATVGAGVSLCPGAIIGSGAEV